VTSPPPEEKLRLGGMALRNGLLVHGPTHWAAAIRSDDGQLRVASGRKPDLGGRASERVPGLRGVLKLAEAIAVVPLVKRALPEAKLPMQDARTLGAMGAAALGGHAVRSAGARTVGREAAVALLSLAPALMALRSGDLAAYHGVEHKAIAGYEADADAQEADKEHDRCGSHLVTPMLAAATVGNVAARRAGLRGPAAEVTVGLGSAAVAVEVFAWSERHPDTAVARALRRPGYEIQRLIGTREPSDDQLEVGRAALAEILRVEDALEP
jgi:uncharacterized protein YqhQ